MLRAWNRLALPLVVLVSFSLPVCAAEQDQEARFRAMLEAGEFAPALAMARQEATENARDARLSRLAEAQAAVGAGQAALATAAEISSGSLRSETFHQSSPISMGAGGGGTMADFESLIGLITSTVAPTTWDEVGGPGSIGPFAGGVWVDAQGAVHRLAEEDATQRLDQLHRQSRVSAAASTARRTSTLRKISLPRLERAVQLRLAAGRSPDATMKALAGLHKIQYVLVYPDTGDLVLAGPASDWQTDREGRLVSSETGRPVLQLDDLVVLWRHMRRPRATFGCSIKPIPESLAKTQAFLNQSARSPLKPGGRSAWLKELRDTLGPQEIEYYGIDPRTRVAQVLLEADYRMKLVGLGLEPGTLGVPSYLSMIEVAPGQAPPSLGVLRWWFSMNYQAIAANASREAFELRGQGVQVQSENEHLAAGGQRVHTGESEPLNRRFAENFTKHFPALAEKYPVYAELQNLFDLALACALAQEHQLASRSGWQPGCFGEEGGFRSTLGFAPRQVESVINHRVVNRTQILAAVSGGVYFDPADTVAAENLVGDKQGTLASEHARSAASSRSTDGWWWD